MPDSSSVDSFNRPAHDELPSARARYRWTLGVRLTIALVTMATLSTLLAVGAQDRALARDLRAAAATRLERSAAVGVRVVEQHLDAFGDRYRAIARTPQLRATLELDDEPTLVFLAEELLQQHGASAIAFADPDGAIIARAGSADVLSLVPEVNGETLRARPEDGALFASTRVALEARDRVIGSLVALERIDASRLVGWSELCGAEVSVSLATDERSATSDRLETTILTLGEGASLVGASGLEAERAAVAHARAELLRAGGLALAISILACIALSRNLVRPIREIQSAIERIGTGSFSQPLKSSRSDEIGDVARGIDRMTIDLMASRAELEYRIGELDRSETHLANAQRLARLGSFEIDLQSGELSGSREFFALIGIDRPPDDVKADPWQLLECVQEEDRELTRQTIEECIRTCLPARLDNRVVGADGGERVMHTQVQIVCDRDARATRLEGTVQDVTERRRAESQIRYLALHDSLTGLGNRLQFRERLEIAIHKARRRNGLIGIICLDLDDFKRINDTLGHSVGDELLQGVADRIVASMRPNDEIVRDMDEPHDELSLSRLGGDEFTLMLTELRDPKVLAPVSQRILDSLRQPFHLDGREIVIGASIGISTWPQDGTDVDTLLGNANSAMYHAKSNGRNSYEYYEESMNAAAQARLEIETRLRRAIESGAIEFQYQPRLEIASGRVVGFEALSRWRDAELGSVSPGMFVPIAEQTGLIVALGRQALHAACRQAAEWERSPLRFDGRISVNVSSHQFKLVDIAREVADALAQSHVNPLRLELEVTESVMLHDEEHVIETLHAVREMGVKIALDDFGTGYSSLSYLRRLPVDVLKIDMSFIRGITLSREDAALARAIVAMGDALGLSVVAEGVETADQREMLRDWGCTELQGFLVSPALPACEAVRWLQDD
jgi:diguanylate cyclase (GGDEF)-like protein/PAS domain S-box-containing protein